MNTTITQSQLAATEEAILGGTTARRGETVMARGEGCWMWDTDGNRYLDLTAGQGVAMLGHCHPALVSAIAEQAAQLITCPNFFYNDVRAEFAAGAASTSCRRISTMSSWPTAAPRAIDGALKFARLTTGRTGIVARHAQLPRPHDRRGLGDVGTEIPQALYAACST